ncbi:MAG: diflavin flavoprotein [Cyanobacteriota bacterium]|nr:diflavin flavoprotein [Cyanobacteriota bacterium]
MVTALPSQQRRLSLQAVDIAPATRTIRSLDWDRDRFDIEFGLKNGTTYNSFLIRGDKIALIDTSHEKFRESYLPLLQSEVDLSQLDYLLISHTEPDHSGLVRDILQLAPQVTVVGSKVALQFLENLVHLPFPKQVVKNGDQLDLGQGHILEFVIAPNLHWPDTMFTYDHQTGILFTCDAFGMHYCDNSVFDHNLALIEEDFRFYYDCLMAPNARSVLSAMKRMDELPTISTIATGHGPLLRHHLSDLTGRYRSWSQAQTKGETTVAVFYVSDYGYSDRLSQAIAKGITKAGVAVEMRDLKSADPQDVRELVEHSAGLVVSTPPTSSMVAQTAVGTVLAVAHSKQMIGLVASCGDDDEPIDPLLTRFTDVGLSPAFPAIRAQGIPTPATYQTCEEAGTDLAQRLTKAKTIQQMKSLDSDLDKALGRLSGGLYIITAQRQQAKSAMLASWVAQASFSPPGITIAVAKDRAIESFMHIGDPFVLNILAEGQHLKLMKHFLKWFPPGADRFEGVKTYPADNQGIILAEALAYLECQVVSRMEASDHWIVYATVQTGNISNPDGLTATHHRKVGNHY